jgi:hypothetical protein
MGLEIQVGTPPVEGRYVVWTPCRALQVREWCEPSIASFHDGRWHAYEPVWGWIGPLPVVHGNDCLVKQREQELWPEGPPELGGTEYDL